MLIQGAVLFAGLPMLVHLLVRLVELRGVGLPLDRAWPDACWSRVAGGFQFVVGCVLVHLACLYLVPVLVGWWIGLDALKETEPVLASIYSALLMIVQWVLTCGLILGYVVLRARGRMAALGLTSRRLPRAVWEGLKTLLAAMPAVIIALFAGAYVYLLVFHEEPAVHEVLEAVQRTDDTGMRVAFFVLAGLVIPLFEELFYRGIILTSLLRTGSAPLAIVVSAAFFGIVHLPVPHSVPALMILGLALGYAYYRTRSLWAPVAMHAAFNVYNLALTVGAPFLVDRLNAQ